MHAHFQTVVGAALIVWAFAATSADGQLFGRRFVPAQPVPTQPAAPARVGDQGAPGQPVPQQANQAMPGDASPANAAVAARAGAGQARFVRGRSLIGTKIWGSNRQYLGSVKDFIVDYQGDCPSIYFAVAPQIPGWNGGYVIVPFTAFQVGFDPQQRSDYFTLNMGLDGLRRAPHLAVDKWDTVHDQNALAGANQFYQRVERTAARPETGGREQNPSLPPNRTQPGERSQPQSQQPQQQPPGTGQQSDQRQPEPPKPAQGTRPNAGQEPSAPDNGRPVTR